MRSGVRGKKREVYSLSVQDIQDVAEQELERRLRPAELRRVEQCVGDYLDWYGAITSAIQEEVGAN